MNESNNYVPPTGPGQPNNQYQWTQPSPKQGPPPGQKFFNSLRQSGFYRSQDRWIGGVSGGLAQKYGVDPLIVRAGFVLLSLLSGIGLIVYAAAWALLPEQRDGRIHAEELIRGNFDGAHAGIIIALVIGFSTINQFFWFSARVFPPLRFLFWLALLGAIIYAAVQFSKPNSTGSNGAPGAPQTPSANANPPYTGTFATAHTPGTSVIIPGVPTSTTDTPPMSTSESATSQFTSAAPTHGQADAPQFGPQAPGDQTPGTADWAGGSGSDFGGGNPTGSQHYEWTAPKPEKPRVKSPGVTQFAVLFGILLLATALILLLNHGGTISLSYGTLPFLAGLAMALGGLAVVINGFRGHASGSGGFFGILGFMGVLATSLFLGIGMTTHSNAQIFSDTSLTPHSISETSGGFAFGAGEVTLDLTKLDMSGVAKEDLPLAIPINAGLGEVTIIIPSDLAVTANQTVGVGTAKSSNGSSSTTVGGIGTVKSPYANDLARETGDSDIFLDIRLGMGEIHIQEQGK